MERAENSAGFEDSRGHLTLNDVRGEFSSSFLDEAECRRWVLGRLHPEGASCPACGRKVSKRCSGKFWNNERISCPGCGKWFNALTGTMLQGIHMDFRTVMLLALFLCMDQPAGVIAGFLGSDKNTVRTWKRRFGGRAG